MTMTPKANNHRDSYMSTKPTPNKEKQRDTIANDVAAFLARGEKIEKLPGPGEYGERTSTEIDPHRARKDHSPQPKRNPGNHPGRPKASDWNRSGDAS